MLFSEKFEAFFNQAERDDLVRELKKYITLLEANDQLISSLNVDRVLDMVLRHACRFTHAENGSIFLINRQDQTLEFAATTDVNAPALKQIKIPLGEGIAGSVAQSGKPVNIRNVRDDERFYSQVDRRTGETTTSYLCFPLKVQGEVIGTAQLLNKKDGQSFDEDDERFMEAFSFQAALAIETALLHRQALEKQKIEQDLKIAREAQKKILPDGPPQLPGLSLGGLSLPARTVGGDYYNYFPNRDEKGNLQFLDLVVADVSGKGIPAALVVTILHTALQILLPRHRDLAELAEALNRYLSENLVVGTFITFFLGRYYPDGGRMEYVNCGHNPPYVFYKKDGPGYGARELKHSGPILGLSPRVSYQPHEATVKPGQMFVAFSDGVVEAQNSAEDLFGERRLLRVLGKLMGRTRENPPPVGDNHPNARADWYCSGVTQSVLKFRAGAEMNDDMTLLIMLA